MESSIPMQTDVGELHGRDAIYLDRVTHTGQGLEFQGEINGALCGDVSRAGVWISYRLCFHSVRAFDARELEICRWSAVSSFDEVHDSGWLRTLGMDAQYRHYALSTYDFIYRIAATGFKFEIISQRPS
jgi:hypothetical protein